MIMIRVSGRDWRPGGREAAAATGYRHGESGRLGEHRAILFKFMEPSSYGMPPIIRIYPA